MQGASSSAAQEESLGGRPFGAMHRARNICVSAAAPGHCFVDTGAERPERFSIEVVLAGESVGGQ
jgi:hypothetical protein